MAKQPEPENTLHIETLPVLSKDDFSVTLNENVAGPSSEGPAIIARINKNEPIVTRKELWAYYREHFAVPENFFVHWRLLSLLQW